MSVVIHFLNGNDNHIQSHYFQKEYRDDVIVEINARFYEVYFFVKEVMEYEMRKDGFFSFPGLIILDEISNEKICIAINNLVDIGYFNFFVGYAEIPYNNRFIHKWYKNELSISKLEKISSYVLRN